MSLEEQQRLEATYLMPTFARKPVELVEGRGMILKDDKGREYLDFLAGIGVVSLGHCHPALVEALAEQASKLIHVGNYYYIEKRGQVAKILSDLLNASVADSESAQDLTPWKLFFANSGAEANECAIKLARLFARRQAERDGVPVRNLIVTLDGSFHGRTLVTLAATAQPSKQEAFQPLPAGFLRIPQNDVAALERLFAERGDEICAVMVECVQGESGVHPCDQEFLVAIRRLTQERGALLICDEVQCGMFRTGKPFSFQNFGIIPDIVTIAKGVASGFPTGMCAAKSFVAQAFEPGDHGTTFGGSNLAVAAALATLSVLTEDGFGQSVIDVGSYLRERLSTLPHVAEVRGYGLMDAIDLDDAALDDAALTAPEVVSRSLEAGLIINATGPRTLRFLPPLICERTHVDILIERLGVLLGG